MERSSNTLKQGKSAQWVLGCRCSLDWSLQRPCPQNLYFRQRPIGLVSLQERQGHGRHAGGSRSVRVPASSTHRSSSRQSWTGGGRCQAVYPQAQ